MKRVLLFLFLFFLVACSHPRVYVKSTVPNKNIVVNDGSPSLDAYQNFLDSYDPILNYSQVHTARVFTFNNCQYLLNTTDFKGKVVAESCGKNCLGGCPNTGPPICYFVVQDDDGCVVFTPSHFWDFDVNHYSPVPGTVFNNFDIDDFVVLPYKIKIYNAPYCLTWHNQSYCTYFVSERGDEYDRTRYS